MNIQTLMNELFRWCADGAPHDYSGTCDTLKTGNPETEVHKVAVSMFATPAVIRAAHEWGAELLIVHEPTFYAHMDDNFAELRNDPVYKAKRELLEKTGLAVWRYHDHPHCKFKDMISEGEIRYLELDGEWIRGPRWAVNRFHLNTPMTPRELLKRVEEKLGARHVRVSGSMDLPCTNLSLCFGTPGGVFEELRNPEIDVVLTGEACEWQLAEYARDAAQLGFRKALMILGHIPSERDGMRLLADLMQERFTGFESRYFECGEAFD